MISNCSVFSVYQPDLPPPMLKTGHSIDAINEINDISEDVEEVVKVPAEAEFVHPPKSPQQVSSLSKSSYEQWCSYTIQCTHISPKAYPRNLFRQKFFDEKLKSQSLVRLYETCMIIQPLSGGRPSTLKS